MGSSSFKLLPGYLESAQSETVNFMHYHNRHQLTDLDKIAAQLKRIGIQNDLSEGKCLHSYILKHNLHQDRYLANILIQMYGKCGCVYDSHIVFNRMHRRNSYTWNILIANYAQHGQLEKAFALLQTMPCPNAVSWNAMITGYTQHGYLSEALHLFQHMPYRNVVSWNAMIVGYSHVGLLEEALQLFQRMPVRDATSWNSIIAAYAQHGDLDKALKLFLDMPQKDVISWTIMLSAYIHLGNIKQALDFFQKMPHRNTVTWSIMISAYAQLGYYKEALSLFQQMPQRNTISWNAMISAYNQQGRHAEAVQVFEKMPNRDIVSWTAVISIHVQNGQLKEAFELFERMPRKDIVCWTIMITAYTQHGHLNRAIELLQQMQLDGLKPDKVTFVGIVDSCNQPVLTNGKLLHAFSITYRLEIDNIVGTALVNMYGKCGSMKDVSKVFDRMCIRDTVSWNALIGAYMQNGHGSVRILREMIVEQMIPGKLTFVNVLAACNHDGMMDYAYHIFAAMRDHSVVATLEHFTCVVDLLGRNGWLDVAESFIYSFAMHPGTTVWMALLTCCRIHNNVDIANRALQNSLVRSTMPNDS